MTNPPQTPMLDKDGRLTPTWVLWLQSIATEINALNKAVGGGK